MRRPLERARILRRTDDQPTLPARVKRILRKYGATLLMPGPAVPILGPELVVGGSFDSAAGWTLFGDSGTISGGVANLTRTSAYTIFERTIQVEANKSYLVSFESRRASGTGIPVFQLRTASNTAGSVVAAASNASPTSQFATNSVNYTAASSATLYVQAGIGTAAAEVSIDSVSVREVLGYQNTYSSFVAGNYKDSTGNTLAAVDQQVGLVIDASQDAGPELMSNGDFAAGLTAWTVHAAGGTADATGGVATVTSGGTNGRIEQAKTLTANKTYIATAYVTLGTAPNMQLECIRGAAGSYASLGKFVSTTPGRQLARFVFVATGADVIVQAKSANGAGTFAIEKVSLRELPGIHASQSTSGYQPYVRAVPKTVGQERTIYAHPTWAAAGGSYTKSAPAWGGVGGSGLAVGKTYRMSFTVSAVTAGSSLGVYRRNAANSDNELVATINVVVGGSYSVAVPVVTDAATYDIWVDNNTFAGTLTNFSVSEVLEWTYAWQFDATDDRLVASAVPFQPADDYFSVFGVVRNSDAVLRRIWEVQNVGIGGGMGVWLTNNTATFYASGATAVTVGVADGPVVITAKKLGNARSIQADNFAATTNTVPVTDHTSLTCVIGNTIAGDRPYSGPIYAGILGKGAISDAEVQTLKRFVARFQGRSL